MFGLWRRGVCGWSFSGGLFDYSGMIVGGVVWDFVIGFWEGYLIRERSVWNLLIEIWRGFGFGWDFVDKCVLWVVWYFYMNFFLVLCCCFVGCFNDSCFFF